MTVEEMIVFASENLKKYDIEESIEVIYRDGVFRAYVMEEDLSCEMFYGDGATLDEALHKLIFSDEGIYYIDEIMKEMFEEEQREREYRNKVYRDKQLYRNA